MKRLFLITASFFIAIACVWAQGDLMNCRGLVIDEQGEPVIGATVALGGSAKPVATATDIDGAFSIKVPKNAKELVISYIGYHTVKAKPAANMGIIRMEPDSKMLQDVIVTQSIARTRQTPVAISELTAGDIEVKLGNQELPEVLKTTPGVWATPDGGGYGDAKINMRGFKSPNVAVIVNVFL